MRILSIARHYRAIGDPAHALAALRRRSYMRGWPRYRATGLQLLIEVALETGDSGDGGVGPRETHVDASTHEACRCVGRVRAPAAIVLA